MPDEDVITPDGGPEPAVEALEAAPVDETPAAPETYTRDELVEALGPRFAERYAGAHDGLEAFKQFGQSFDQTLGLVGRGAHLEPQDEQFYRDLGIEPPAQEEPEEEPVEPLYGAPWAPMDDWPRIEQYLVSEHSNARQQAAEAVWARPDAPEEYKNWALNQWYELDPTGATKFYTERQAEIANETLVAPLREEIAALREQLAPVQQHHQSLTNEARSAKLQHLATLAKSQVPDFDEHSDGVTQMLERYGQEYGIDYFDRLLALPVDQQLAHITELTGAVAWRGRPAAEAQAQAESAAADAAKVAAGGERGRGAAGTSGGQTQKKREFTASFERLRDVEIPIR